MQDCNTRGLSLFLVVIISSNKQLTESRQHKNWQGVPILKPRCQISWAKGHGTSTYLRPDEEGLSQPA